MTLQRHDPALSEHLLRDFDPIFRTFPLSELDGQRIFLTGGTGFVGYWLLLAFRWLNQNGARIQLTVLSRDPERFLDAHPEHRLHPWLDWVQGDTKWYSYPTQPFDAFIHGAADTSPTAARSVSLFDDITHGTQHVLEHARHAGAAKVLLISSGAVYDTVPEIKTPILENMAKSLSSGPVSDYYGQGKRLMEQSSLIWSQTNRATLTIARCFSFVGFGLPEHLAASQFVHDALHRPEIQVAGNGRAVRSFLYAADMAVWLLAILARGANGRAYNIGSPDGYTIEDIATLIRDQIAPKKTIRIHDTDKRSPRLFYVPNVGRITGELGVSVWTPTAQGLAKMMESNRLYGIRS